MKLEYHGKIINNLTSNMEYITCNPLYVNMSTVVSNSVKSFVVQGTVRVIGSCYFFVVGEVMEILWNIQPQFNHEHYGITNSEAYNSTVLIPESHSSNFYVW